MQSFAMRTRTEVQKLTFSQCTYQQVNAVKLTHRRLEVEVHVMLQVNI